MIYRFLIIIYLFLSSINCINIELSLDNKNEEELNPFVISLYEPLIEKNKINPIDLFVVYDNSNYMRSRKQNLKEVLFSIFDILDVNDSLSLISFNSACNIELQLTLINNIDKEKFKTSISNYIDKGKFDNPNRNYVSAIKEGVISQIEDIEEDNGRVQSIIFIVSGNNKGGSEPINYLKKLDLERKYDFTMHILSFGNVDRVSNNLVNFAIQRDGSFYAIKDFQNVKKYALNIIGGIKTSKYKMVNISIISNYKLRTFYAQDHLPYYSKSSDYEISFPIFQFIIGKEYTFVFLLNINKKPLIGDRILFVNVAYKDFKGNLYKASKSLRFYNSIYLFNFKKDEYCRVWALTILQKYKNIEKNKDNLEGYNKEINYMKKTCEVYLNANISKTLVKIGEGNKEYKQFYMNGVVSEAFLKKGGTNFWYSNEYQLQLINDENNKKIN